MGGRIWSMKEESVFWYLVRHSPKRLGKDLINNPEQPWAQLSDTMHAKMGADARRQYTGLSLCEYFFLAPPRLERAVTGQQP